MSVDHRGPSALGPGASLVPARTGARAQASIALVYSLDLDLRHLAGYGLVKLGAAVLRVDLRR